MAVFVTGRILLDTNVFIDYLRAGTLFRALHGDGSRRGDRLGPINDLLIALTAWRIGASVVTVNSGDFNRIPSTCPGSWLSNRLKSRRPAGPRGQ